MFSRFSRFPRGSKLSKVSRLHKIGFVVASWGLSWVYFTHTRQSIFENNKRFTVDEILIHNNRKDGIWVTRGDSVYDISSFVDNHPGGIDKILLAAGKSIDPFWKIFSIHHSSYVFDTLQEYYIGKIQHDEDTAILQSNDSMSKLFKDEPTRLLDFFTVLSEHPFNAETKSEHLDGNYITDNKAFYIRNHLPVPATNEEDYTLEINIDDKQHLITLQQLKTGFPQKEIIATLQCSGNRRNQMLPKTQGLPWGIGAIGTAKWKGVTGYDVLHSVGFANEMDTKFKHVEMCGKDGYCTSIPLDKFLQMDTILAIEMSGEKLPIDHGAPLRAVVPGYIGARSVKWLHSISLIEEESKSFWQQKDYKLFPSAFDGKDVLPTEADYAATPSLQKMPIQSAIVKVTHGENATSISGYAISGTGGKISRVDVSNDGGETWAKATVFNEDHWAWTLWKAEFPKDEKRQQHFICKAIMNEEEQPKELKDIWNYRGLLNNSWHNIHF